MDFGKTWLRRGLAARLAGLAAAAVGLMPAVAHAAWAKAETDRFVVYSDVGPQTAAEYATKLTQYDAVLRLMNHVPAGAPRTQKVDVYLVRNHRELTEALPGMPDDIAGIYEAQPGAVFAIGVVGQGGMRPDTVLFHEYAHHFMLENFPAAYPAWYVEGWAEYFSTVSFTPTSFTVGLYDNGRKAWLNHAQWMPLDKLLTTSTWQLKSDAAEEIYYAQSWLLMHYMMDTPKRAAELDQASRAIAGGEDAVKAMQAATGQTPDQMLRALHNYDRVDATTYPIGLLKDAHAAPVVSVLPASADDLLLDHLRLQVTYAGMKAPELLAQVREKAAKHPGDRLAELTLARAEFVLGDPAKGDAIVTRLLAANDKDVEALRDAGVGELDAGDRDKAERTARYRTGRSYLARAYKLDPNDYRTLLGYAVSREVEPGYPDANDLNALLAAHVRAPAVGRITLDAASALIDHGRGAEALTLLTPVANNPHGGDESQEARAMIAKAAPSGARAEARTSAAPGAAAGG